MCFNSQEKVSLIGEYFRNQLCTVHDQPVYIIFLLLLSNLDCGYLLVLTIYFLSKNIKNKKNHLKSVMFLTAVKIAIYCIAVLSLCKLEPRREKTGFLHMRKQRRRSASR